MWQQFNNNPTGRSVGDCAVRAVSVALGISWEQSFALLAAMAFAMGDMPSADAVWAAVLRSNGFRRESIPNSCPMCYTASDFASEHPRGVYVLGFGGHVATIKDGVLYDSWDSSNEIPQFYWYKEQ